MRQEVQKKEKEAARTAAGKRKRRDSDTESDDDLPDRFEGGLLKAESDYSYEC